MAHSTQCAWTRRGNRKAQPSSAGNDLVRMVLTGYLGLEFADRPDLLESVVPVYPPGAKRMLRDNGVWARTLKRDNVRLITAPLREITPSGIVTDDGEEHEVDVIVYGTGFQRRSS